MVTTDKISQFYNVIAICHICVSVISEVKITNLFVYIISRLASSDRELLIKMTTDVIWVIAIHLTLHYMN